MKNQNDFKIKLLEANMKRFINSKTYFFMMVCLVVGLLTIPAQAATEEEIEVSVVAGLNYLAGQQNANGSWNHWGGENVGVTGLAVLKFEDRAIDLGISPLDPSYEYSDVVAAGLAYLIANSHTQDITSDPEPAGNPDSDGDGIGIYLMTPGDFWHRIYYTGIGMMAIAASGDLSLEPMLQDMVDFMAWAQADPGCGLSRGGWRYNPDECSSDNSNSGYATLGLGFASASPPYGMELTIPQYVLDELSIWLNVIQYDNDGHPKDGGSHYDEWDAQNNDPWAINMLKTGNLLYELFLVGDAQDSPRVQEALGYIARRWYGTDDWCGVGEWQNNRQAMFTLMKGLEAYGIELIDLDLDSIPEHDWFEEVSTHLVTTQNPDGSWPSDCWGDDAISTAWALLTLEKAVPPSTMFVDLDIKPCSWPNPLNVKSKGVLPVAILGSEEFDVTEIDPATLLLEGVAPLRWSVEDVTGSATVDECNVTEDGPDGFDDLTVKFDMPEIVAALGEVNDGDELILTLTGNLLNELALEGDDCIVIRKKGNLKKAIALMDQNTPEDYNLSQNYPNPFNPTTSIRFSIPEKSFVTINVVNVLGEEVALLAKAYMDAGYYEITFNGSNLPSGIYIYRMQTEKATITRKLMLLK